jgi:hypothetical protein
MPSNVYLRKLSREDADTGTILITRDRWRMFPKPLEEFVVEAGGERFITTIVPEDCACVPPPHQHYHLEAGHFRDRLGLATGLTVVIERAEGVYRIRTE